MIRLLYTGLFYFVIYFWMLLLAIVGTPFAIFSRDATYWVARTYCRGVFIVARVMCGIRCEVRGTPPTGEVLIAAKHQSFLDILMIFEAVPRAKFIMKREILYTPIIGYYAKRIGSAPVHRGKKGETIRKMMSDVEKEQSDPSQLVIYPQGTRIKPGVKAPYKVGAGVIYDRMAKDCVPVATNVGVFWARNGLSGKRGAAIIEFLPTIPSGMPLDDFMSEMENTVEGESNRLMREAGFDVSD